MLLGSNHTWGDKLENGFQGFFDFLPNLIGFLAVLIIGYFVAKIIARVITRLLHRSGLDRRLTEGQGGQYVAKLTPSPSGLLGRLAFWALFLGVIALAVSVLGIAALTAFVGAILAYIPNVIAALLIFLIAGAIAAGVAALVARTMGDTPTGKVLATVVPGLVMAIAIFMILNQLKIAPTIVTITYAALIGALALAAALAFGLGGREVAARMLEGAYVKGQASREQVRRDLQQGRERAREDVARARETAAPEVEGDTVSPGSRMVR
jgi:Conserved TM helix